MLANPVYTYVVRLPKNDHSYRTWEAYTLYYAERRGGETMLEKVKTFFSNDNPVDALTAVTKLQ
ncbi:hypothetical protein GQ600_1917 [Phytophthora cactorum]|nr:hypothetical protein GQ600_1917 [Phytophthora cactorum]